MWIRITCWGSAQTARGTAALATAAAAEAVPASTWPWMEALHGRRGGSPPSSELAAHFFLIAPESKVSPPVRLGPDAAACQRGSVSSAGLLTHSSLVHRNGLPELPFDDWRIQPADIEFAKNAEGGDAVLGEGAYGKVREQYCNSNTHHLTP